MSAAEGAAGCLPPLPRGCGVVSGRTAQLEERLAEPRWALPACPLVLLALNLHVLSGRRGALSCSPCRRLSAVLLPRLPARRVAVSAGRGLLWFSLLSSCSLAQINTNLWLEKRVCSRDGHQSAGQCRDSEGVYPGYREPRPGQRAGLGCFWACVLSDSELERPRGVQVPFTPGLLSSWLKRCLYMKREVLGSCFP